MLPCCTFMYIKMALVLIFLFLHLLSQTSGLCQVNDLCDGTNTQDKSTYPGSDNLELNCLMCDKLVTTWYQYQGSKPCGHCLESTDSRYVVENVTAQDGGVYKCECNGTVKCFNVTVISKIHKLEVYPEDVRVNRPFNLTCSAVGYPPPRWFRFISSNGNTTAHGALPTDMFHTTVVRTIIPDSTSEYSGKYKCFACENEHDCKQAVNDIFITINEEPTIVNTNHNYSSLGPSFTCTVQHWNADSTFIQWIDNSGNPVSESSDKYNISLLELNDGRASSTLYVNNYQRSDDGVYTCLLTLYGTAVHSRYFMLNTSIKNDTNGSVSDEGPIECHCEETTCTVWIVLFVVATVLLLVMIARILSTGLLCYVWKWCINQNRSAKNDQDSGQPTQSIGDRRSIIVVDNDTDKDGVPSSHNNTQGRPPNSDLQSQLVSKGIRMRLPSKK